MIVCTFSQSTWGTGTSRVLLGVLTYCSWILCEGSGMRGQESCSRELLEGEGEVKGCLRINFRFGQEKKQKETIRPRG